MSARPRAGAAQLNRGALGGAAIPMTAPSPDPVAAVFRRFFAGEIQATQAAVELDALGGQWVMFPPSSLTPEQSARLKELDAARGALVWERLKGLHPSFPAVPYGSDEYWAFISSAPRANDGAGDLDPGPGGTA